MESLTFSIDSPASTNALDQCLREELAAAATYEQALGHVESPFLRNTLEKNRRSHADRSVTLAQLVRRRGASASNEASPWSVFTRLVAKGATALGDEAVLKVMHEGEAYLTSSYAERFAHLDEEAARTFARDVVDPQKQCQRRLAELLPS